MIEYETQSQLCGSLEVHEPNITADAVHHSGHHAVMEHLESCARAELLQEGSPAAHHMLYWAWHRELVQCVPAQLPGMHNTI